MGNKMVKARQYPWGTVQGKRSVVGVLSYDSLGNVSPRYHQRISCVISLLSVENENHCDFVKLREMLIRTNMEDLREQTHQSHYELYRRERLQEMGFSDLTHEGRSIGLGETFEQKRAEHQKVR